MENPRRYARVFVIEDLSLEMIEVFSKLLLQKGFGAGLDGMFWLPVPASSLHGIFLEHTACVPYRMALELDATHIRLELLMRGSGTMSCICTGYGGAELEACMIQSLEKLLAEAMIYL